MIILIFAFVKMVEIVFQCSSLYDRVSLDLSFTSIIASINLAILIYLLEAWKEEKKENNEIERSKSEMIYNIEMSFQYSVFFTSDTLDSWPAKDIENVFLRNIATLHKCLNNNEFKLLQKFIECIVEVRDSNERVEFSYFLKDYLRTIFLSGNANLVYCSENFDYFRDDVIALLSKLKNEYSYNAKASSVICSKDGLTSIEKIDDNKVRIKRDGKLVVEGSYQFNVKGEAYFDEGYSELVNPYYKEYYKNAKFDGYGEYNYECLKSGTWSANYLVDGIQNNVLIKYHPKKATSINEYKLKHIKIDELNEISIILELIDNIEELKDYTNKCDAKFYVVDLLYQNQERYIENVCSIDEFENLLRSMNKISAAKG